MRSWLNHLVISKAIGRGGGDGRRSSNLVDTHVDTYVDTHVDTLLI